MRIRDRRARMRAKSALWQLLPLLLVCAALPAPSATNKHQTNDPSAPAAIVHMTADNKFVPEKVAIKAGEAVRWINDGGGPSHTVTTDPSMVQNEDHVQIPDGAQSFSSEVIGPGKFFQHTFEVPGTYRYACAPHEGSKMLGEVVVTK
jgi:plastocyanin